MLDARVEVRLTAQELEDWRVAAEADGRTLASFVRWVMNARVRPTTESTEPDEKELSGT